MGAFIYALSADKTSPALAAHTTQSQPCFLAASIPLPSPAATSFYSNADRADNTLHFARAGLAEVEGSDLSVLGALLKSSVFTGINVNTELFLF